MDINDKFKEAKPHDTIQKIRTILHDIGISTIDYFFDSEVENCHSVRVNIADTTFGTNGKGARKDFALASGYAEFMERLQTNLLYIGGYDEVTEKSCGFYITPDESYTTIDDLLNCNNPFVEFSLNILIPEIAASESAVNFMEGNASPAGASRIKRKAISLWKVLEPINFTEGDFISIPYYDVKNDRIISIPNNLLLSYASNGLCAGNTPHEAMVQGLSELFERYTYSKIINDRLTPPDIPDDYLANFPEIVKYKKLIETSGSYRVIFKDFSLGKSFPVAAVILIDYQKQTYKVSVGSHPSIAIALERSITELFQGFCLKKAATCNRFSYNFNAGLDAINLGNILKCAYGKYPIEFFLDESSYEFKPFQNISGENNKTLLANLVKILFDEGFNLYIRDCSYLGFPTFHLVSLGLSEIYANNLLAWKERNARKKAELILNNLHRATNDELASISVLIKFKLSALFENSIPFLLKRPIKSKFIGDDNAMEFLDFLITYKLKLFEKAVDMIDQICQYTLRKSSSGDYQYYKCIRDYINAKIAQTDDRDIENILNKFYDREIVNRVIEEFADSDDVLNRFYEKTSCFDCAPCAYKASCDYEIVKNVKLRTKAIYKDKMPNQLEIKSIFSSLRTEL